MINKPVYATRHLTPFETEAERDARKLLEKIKKNRSIKITPTPPPLEQGAETQGDTMGKHVIDQDAMAPHRNTLMKVDDLARAMRAGKSTVREWYVKKKNDIHRIKDPSGMVMYLYWWGDRHADQKLMIAHYMKGLTSDVEAASCSDDKELARTKHALEEARGSIKLLQGDLQDAYNKCARLEHELQIARGTNGDAEIKKLRDEHREYLERLHDIVDEGKAFKDERSLEEKLKDLVAEVEVMSSKREESEHALGQAQKRISDLQQQLTELGSKYTTAQEQFRSEIEDIRQQAAHVPRIRRAPQPAVLDHLMGSSMTSLIHHRAMFKALKSKDGSEESRALKLAEDLLVALQNIHDEREELLVMTYMNELNVQ